MRDRSLLFALVAGGMLLAASPALAQDSTTGAVKGVISDQEAGGGVAGATVVISGPALQGTQAEITDSSGTYYLANLPPGVYLVTVYYGDATFERPNALVRLGKTAQINIPINLKAGQGEVITLEGRAPLIDQGSTKTGRTITQDYTQNIPTGRTFGAVLGAAAGSQSDLYGVSFGGSTSAENIYIVEGLNTTDPAFGLLSTNLPNEFVQETEVITGGYNAEYGRSTGGVINIVTKSGGNEFSGSVFSYFTPGALVADELETPSASSSINTETELDYSWDIGAEFGGPIIKDKLWFHVGFNPSFRNTKYHRIISTRVDRDDIDNDGVADGNGVADTDASGFAITEELDRTTRDITSQTMYFTGKITGAVTPDHQGSISYLGNPRSSDTFRGAPGAAAGDEIETTTGATDVAAKWTSKFFNNKTQIDIVAGYHSNESKTSPRAQGAGDTQIIHNLPRTLSDYSAFEMQDHGAVPAGCDDSDANDPFPLIANCPVNSYNLGGLGFSQNRETSRTSGALAVTQRVKALGHHEFKAGADFEYQRYDNLRSYSGGGSLVNIVNFGFAVPRTRRFYQLLTPDDVSRIGTTEMVDGFEVPIEACDIGVTDDTGAIVDVPCRIKPSGQADNTTTRNISAFFRDSWQVMPNLTLNAGLRWEQQSLLVADEIKDTYDWTTDAPVDAEAINISNMLAPRLGFIYDPTQEGRSKIYSHYGRFYESVPMDINSRAYGGEVLHFRFLNPGGCNIEAGTLDPDVVQSDFLASCDESNKFFDLVFGGGTEQVVPNLGGQYLDELVIGGEYELLNDLKVGAAYIYKGLGRAIEDISIDGGTTYVIANPGQIDEDAVMEQLENGEISQEVADNLLASANFDVPTRTYNALQLTAEKRFSRDLMIQASYTYSRLEGNHPGLFSPETGQLDPNLTSMYDLPELMANRTGRLAADRPHNLKIDGYYRLEAKKIGFFNFGTSVRAASGIPHNVLGAHSSYGADESYILPRAAAARSPFTTQFDVQAAYGRQLSKTVQLQAFLQVFNVFNQQAGIDVSERYTRDVVNPIVGGDENDLAHAKELQNSAGSDRVFNNVLEKNPNFGNIITRQAPLTMRFGMRLTF